MLNIENYTSITHSSSNVVRVIVADDDDDSVGTFSDYLKIKGLDVIGTASNGLEVFELYKKLKPDVVILDMSMPEYDGKYAIDNIKKEDADAKIIVVSGYMDDKIKNLGANAVFYKPYNINDIMTAINKITV